MNIWIVKSGEILPDDNNSRLMRSGKLYEKLLSEGHEVTWWCSRFDHFKKKFIKIKKEENIRLINSIGYKKNISIRRIIDHKILSLNFRNEIKSEIKKPDLIVCCMPTIDLLYESIIFAKNNNIKIIVDIRDLWPDAIRGKFNYLLELLLEPLIYYYKIKLKKLLLEADSIIAISQNYLDWAYDVMKIDPRKEDRVFELGYESNCIKLQDIANTNNKIIIISFIGTFGSSYDFETLINVANILEIKNIKNIKIKIAGYGEKEKNILNKIKKLKNVEFMGWLNKKEIEQLLIKSDVGLMIYNKKATQSLPNKFFEYISFGCALINSLDGEVSEIIDKNNIGWNYRAEDEYSLLNVLMLISCDKNLGLKKINAFKLFNENYTDEIIYTKMINYLVN
jgi:glycosyltransferase involved in cell wall biosynthesis